ncbi:hypothetical protein [Mameliella alba]|uniref:hypothetical protein n=1 Tax=Mameliella alba TaxID=561184 RepID=UPI0013FE2609|nr:hypothetical protein [Mameliella alba]
MTRPHEKWTSAEIAQHIHGMGEAPRDECSETVVEGVVLKNCVWVYGEGEQLPPSIDTDDRPAPRKDPPHPLALAYIAMPLVFLACLVFAAILWGKL